MKSFRCFSHIVLILRLCIIANEICYGQSPENATIYTNLLSVEKDNTLSIDKKLQEVLALKSQFKHYKLNEDSVYARILHRIGLYEFLLNHEIPTPNAINYTIAAIRINSAPNKNSSPSFCVNSYTNLGNYYKTLQMYQIAAQYYDSAILYRRRFHVPVVSEITLLLDKAVMLNHIGDYQKAVEELNLAIRKAKGSKDAYLLQVLLNQRAQSYLLNGQPELALRDVNLASNVWSNTDDNPELINSMMIKGRILAFKKDLSSALSLLNRAVRHRLKTDDYVQISDDYTDIGNFYLNELHNYKRANDSYLTAIQFAAKAQDVERLSKGHINLQLCSFKQHEFAQSEQYCIRALKDLKIPASNNILFNPVARQLRTIGNKELILVILGNKTELLLKQFERKQEKTYLTACLQTALLTDTLITIMRHEQIGEQSKLYWREWTRELYAHALEACYLANDASLAFYFMEKSRAVLLNDRLNELGASAQLPDAEAGQERELQIAVVSEQQKLDLVGSDENAYEVQEAKLSEAKGALEHYIRSLEKRYPAYYQYKYADEVLSVNALQKQLMTNKQSFVHYFISDTVGYILGITPSTTRLIKLQKNEFNTGMFTSFLRLCSDELTSNNKYSSFVSSSYLLYKLLFEPLKIPKGRVIICTDNFLIPFEALSSDNTGSELLVRGYIFSYVYSAGYMLKNYRSHKATGDFIGFAPVSFKRHADIADLRQSGNALGLSARHYRNPKLLINSQASRRHFLHALSGYTVVNVFSHARADTTDHEPILFMYDSLIHLSELPLLHQPATRLVVLSACETNVGRNAKGEGILSLARGFASAGVPSVAATMWAADEKAIYAISEKFHEFLSKGMSKDEALQKSKLFYIENGEHQEPVPYYWANMILIGNAESIALSRQDSFWFWIAPIIFLISILPGAVLIIKKRDIIKYFNRPGSL